MGAPVPAGGSTAQISIRLAPHFNFKYLVPIEGRGTIGKGVIGRINETPTLASQFRSARIGDLLHKNCSFGGSERVCLIFGVHFQLPHRTC